MRVSWRTVGPGLLWIVSAVSAGAAPPPPPDVANLPYRSGAELTDYQRERCQLDLFWPAPKTPGFATLVWFHGGGLTAGTKNDGFTRGICRSLASAGVAVAAVNYRLSPKVTYPAYIEDAAAAVAWVRAHIAEYGGAPERVFVGGHSAGAYLSAMLAMDPRWLQRHGLKPTDLGGYIPVSGQMTTHFTVRKERGIASNCVIADEAAPIYYSRKDTPRLLVVWADRDFPARCEENAYFVAVLKVAGCTNVTGLMVPGRDHGSIAGGITRDGDPVRQAMLALMGVTAPAAKP